jgi:ribosomal protein S27E
MNIPRKDIKIGDAGEVCIFHPIITAKVPPTFRDHCINSNGKWVFTCSMCGHEQGRAVDFSEDSGWENMFYDATCSSCQNQTLKPKYR